MVSITLFYKAPKIGDIMHMCKQCVPGFSSGGGGGPGNVGMFNDICNRDRMLRQ